MSADDFELRLAQAARALVAEPVSIDVIRAAAAFTARTSVKPRMRARGRLIGIFAVVLAITLAGLAISPGSPIRRLLVATLASPSPTLNSMAPPAVPVSTPAPTTAVSASPSTLTAASPSPAAISSPDASDQATHLLGFTAMSLNGRPSVSIANADGTNPRVIGTDSFLSWSPSGRYLLTTNGKSTVLDPTGAVIGTFPFGLPFWSPDDRVLILHRAPNGGTTNMFSLYDVSGSLLRDYQAPDGVTSFGGASWAPDGHAFVTTGCEGCAGDTPAKDIVSDLWVIAADGSGATKITHTPHEYEDNPAWSPDGTSISFWTNCRTAHEDCSRADWGTWLVAPDGTNPREILSHIGGAVWSPDGSHLAYSHGDAALGRIFVAPADGGDALPLTDGRTYDRSPVWAPADRVAYTRFGSGHMLGQIMVTRADGTQAEPDVLGVDWGSFGWQP